MKAFDYVRPASVAEALAAAARPGAAYLAAGTNLVDLMKGGVTRPDVLVDITRLPGLAGIEHRSDGSTRIGALVRNAVLAHDPTIATRYPALAEALLSGASGQLRNAATTAGNVLQRTRCQYFTDTASACNKRAPGTGCDAIGGVNRAHAVLGWSRHCIATHPSDFCVPLAALDAIVEIEGPGGPRSVPLEAFHRLPGDHPERETVLEPGELVVAVTLPPGADGFAAHSRYLKVRERTSYAFAVVSAAVALRMDGDRIAQARIALGSVALKPWRAREAESLLAGAAPTPETFAQAAQAALAEATPSGDNAYKIELARRIVVRALTLSAAGTPARVPALRQAPSPQVPSPRPSPPPALPPEPRPMSERQRHGASIGQPLTRRDGPDKVTGAARYSADFKPEGLVHAVMAVSAIARGRVTHLDVAAAEAHPGVIAVMTPGNAPKLAKSPDLKDNPFAFRLDLLQNDGVRYANQPIAVVIGQTLEAATEGAALLAPRYEAEPVSVALGAGEVFTPETIGAGSPTSEGSGDVAAGMAAAEARIEASYDTAAQYHNALEPHSSVAQWDGDRLTLHTPTQALWIAKGRLAGLFGIPPENIHVICHYLGGGFGSKGFIAAPQILGIMAAKFVGRPVKLVTRREQMFGPVGHRAATRQTLKLGATRDGTLTALDHHTLTLTSRHDDFVEPSGILSRHLYAAGAISTTHAVSRADIGTPIFMRAPGEASGSVAVESALDELALELDLDPLEIRLRNYAEVEPITHRPFSSKALRECYAQGATRFGWASRPRQPRQMRDADGLLVGWGLGTATYPAGMMQGEARATIRADGTALIETAAQDMGQGAWTVLAQIGADGLGLPVDRVDLRIGDSNLPNGGLAGGSTGTATSGTAVHNATQAAIAELAALAVADRASPLYGAGNAGVTAADGRLARRDDPARSESFSEILSRAGKACVEAKGQGQGDPASRKTYAMHAHGAVYAEVKVDPDLGQIRVTRLVGAFAAGRIVNPHLVRSQYYGGMIWGVSLALHEHAVLDPRSGRVMNGNLAEYHIPVNADVPSMEAILVEEHDPHVNPLGIKGVGELGITGTAGAIANAVWHATGIRVRDIPITLDKLLG